MEKIDLIKQRERLIYCFSAVGCTSLFVFGLVNLAMGTIFSGWFELGACGLAVGNVLYLRFFKNTSLAATMVLLIMTVVLVFLFLTGGIAGTGLLWFYVFPPLAFFLKGKAEGLWWVGGIGLVVMVVLVSEQMKYLQLVFAPLFLYQFLVSFIAMSALVFFYESAQTTYRKFIEEYNREMEEANDQLAIEVVKRSGVQEQLRESTRVTLKQNKQLEKAKKDMQGILENLEKERQELALAKAKDEAILGSIGDGLVVVDAQGRFLFFNTNAERIMGLGALQADPKEWAKLYGVYYPENMQTLVPMEELPPIRTLRGETFDNVQLFIKNNKLEQGVYITVTGRPMRDQSGTILGGVVIFHDITHDKEVDKAKTEFVSLASHQLRTPLTSIGWYTEMLLDKTTELNSEQKEYLEQIYASNKRMVALVNSLLNVSRIDLGTFAIEPELLEVSSISQSVIQELQPQIIEKKLKIKEVYNPDVPILKADPKLIRIVFQNLISNAVKYTTEKGRIEVVIDLTMRKSEHGAGVEKDGILIKVTDTGYGIPAAQQSKIFTKLFRADNAREREAEGTGLGLYVVKSIVDAAGGKIWFESEENKGTTFHVILPLIGMKKKVGTKGLS